MSELKQSLLEQIAGNEPPDVGKAFKKLFETAPTTDYAIERKRYIDDLNKQIEAASAESKNR